MRILPEDGCGNNLHGPFFRITGNMPSGKTQKQSLLLPFVGITNNVWIACGTIIAGTSTNVLIVKKHEFIQSAFAYRNSYYHTGCLLQAGRR
jgi:hypothetical protein